MVYENVQVEHSNLAIGRTGSSFYTMDHNSNRLIEKNSSGTVIFSYFLDTDIIEVNALKFDGYYFWSLERQGTAGFRVRKWEIGEDDLVRSVQEISHASTGVNPFDTHAMAVEYYSAALSNSLIVGQTVFNVVDASIVRAGDPLVIGPSTAIGYEGNYDKVNVVSKVGTTLTVSPAVLSNHSSSSAIYFTRKLWIFSDVATSGMSGCLYKFRSSDGVIETASTGNMYNLVRGAVFFKNHVMFARAGEVIWLDPDSYNIIKSQAIDNLDEDRGTPAEVADLAGFSNTLYRLEQQHVYYNVPTSSYETEDWSPLYNYNTSSVIAEIYFVAVKASKPIVHIAAAGVPADDTQSTITVTVLDQFRTPVLGRSVSFGSTGGSVSPTSGVTDSEGMVKTTYTANTTLGQVTVTATAT